jgi:hypothetical protein
VSTIGERLARLIHEANHTWPAISGRLKLAQGQAVLWWNFRPTMYGMQCEFEIQLRCQPPFKTHVRLIVDDVSDRAALDGLGQVMPFVLRLVDELDAAIAVGDATLESVPDWKKLSVRSSPMRALAAPSSSEQGEDQP